MVAVATLVLPVTTPVTTPPASTVATAGVLLLQVLPPLLLNVVVPPWQTLNVPPIEPGFAFTVTTLVTVLPPAVYEIVVVPGAMPATMPVVMPIVPTVVLELTQVPPVALLPNVIVEPMHTLEGPVIEVNSWIVADVLLKKSPDVVPFPFTAFSALAILTAPVPDDGATHVADTV
jgi:hypothetical protein